MKVSLFFITENSFKAVEIKIEYYFCIEKEITLIN